MRKNEDLKDEIKKLQSKIKLNQISVKYNEEEK